MTILDTPDVARLCHDAGFRGEGLLTAVAVAKAESGFRTDAVGDVSLVDSEWGPSVGLFQVRSLHAEHGTGGTRDELANVDPAHNARSAFTISAGGTNFRPWSVFLSGTYLRHVDSVRAACVAVDSTAGIAAVPDARPLLRQGDAGPAVTELQRLLDGAGFPCAVDGDFGPETAGAVRGFQAARQLPVDGIVGPQTWSALTPVGAAPA